MYVGVCLCMYGYVFRRALRYRAETWHGGPCHGLMDRSMSFESIFSKRPHQRSKVIQRPSCFKKCPLATKFGRKNPWTPDFCSSTYSRGFEATCVYFIEVNIYIAKIFKSVWMCLCMYGYVFRRALRYRAETWRSMPWTHGRTGPWVLRAYFRSDPTKGQRSSRGQVALKNALWPPNLVGKTPDRSAMHCWG